jgi:hypothetical protein
MVSQDAPPRSPRPDARSRADRALVLVAILVVGWSIAGAMYLTTPPDVVDEDVYDLTHSRRYERAVEQFAGKAALLGNDLREWIEGQWEGRRRARTVAVLTAAAAGGYAFLTRPRRARGGGADRA